MNNYAYMYVYIQMYIHVGFVERSSVGRSKEGGDKGGGGERRKEGE